MDTNRTKCFTAALPVLVAALVGVAQTSGASAPGNAGPDTVTIGKLQWAQTTSGQDLRWPEAVEYCRALELAGHGDWRLPTLKELETLHDPEAPYGMRSPIAIETCCLWSGESLVDRPAEDGDEIGGSPGMYQWGFMFDGGLHYYAVHIFEDGQALCVRDAGSYQ